VLDRPLAGAEIQIDFSYAAARASIGGLFPVYFSREQYEMARIGRRERTSTSEFERKGQVRLFEFRYRNCLGTRNAPVSCRSPSRSVGEAVGFVPGSSRTFRAAKRTTITSLRWSRVRRALRASVPGSSITQGDTIAFCPGCVIAPPLG